MTDAVGADRQEVEVTLLGSVYRGEKPSQLRDALNSVVAQTRPAEQVVLVCDGPLSPELDAVLEEFAPRMPLTLVRLPRNVGLAPALNAGLAHCRGRWVARFDTDDLCTEDRLAVQMSHLAMHPEIDVLGSFIEEFDDDPSRPYCLRTVPLDHQAIRAGARRRNPMNHMTVVVRREVLRASGGYPVELYFEDWALWVELLQRGARFENLPLALVRARAGLGMLHRRGGWRYILSEVAVQRRFHRVGFIGTIRLIGNIAARTVARLMPAKVRYWLYVNALRTSAAKPR
jgi:glycosyltransferase involved in cell wall biosynthesis